MSGLLALFRKNADLRSMEIANPSIPVSLSGGETTLSKHFDHLLLLPTHSPDLGHLSAGLVSSPLEGIRT